MKQSATVIFEEDYLKYKQDFINENYDTVNYVSLFNSLVGQAIATDQIILGFDDLIHMNLLDETIILAIPLSVYTKQVIQLLFKLKVRKENIVLLFGVPHYYGNENVRLFNNAVGYDIDSNGEIICIINNNRILVETNNELCIIREVYGEMCYDFFIPHNNITVIDIGMNIGVASIFFSQLSNVTNIYSFEPFMPTYSRAIENFQINNVNSKIMAHSFGLSNENKSLDLSYNEDLKGLMSTVRDNSVYSKESTKKVSILVKDVAEVFNQIISEHSNSTFVFKIDCEGGEYDIISRLNETGLIKRINMILLEFHNLPNQNISKIETILRQNNFSYHAESRNSPAGMLYAWVFSNVAAKCV